MSNDDITQNDNSQSTNMSNLYLSMPHCLLGFGSYDRSFRDNDFEDRGFSSDRTYGHRSYVGGDDGDYRRSRDYSARGGYRGNR